MDELTSSYTVSNHCDYGLRNKIDDSYLLPIVLYLNSILFTQLLRRHVTKIHTSFVI